MSTDSENNKAELVVDEPRQDDPTVSGNNDINAYQGSEEARSQPHLDYLSPEEDKQEFSKDNLNVPSALSQSINNGQAKIHIEDEDEGGRQSDLPKNLDHNSEDLEQENTNAQATKSSFKIGGSISPDQNKDKQTTSLPATADKNEQQDDPEHKMSKTHDEFNQLVMDVQVRRNSMMKNPAQLLGADDNEGGPFNSQNDQYNSQSKVGGKQSPKKDKKLGLGSGSNFRSRQLSTGLVLRTHNNSQMKTSLPYLQIYGVPDDLKLKGEHKPPSIQKHKRTPRYRRSNKAGSPSVPDFQHNTINSQVLEEQTDEQTVEQPASQQGIDENDQNTPISGEPNYQTKNINEESNSGAFFSNDQLVNQTAKSEPFPPNLSLKTVKVTRKRIENDVMRMHSRVHLLQIEEEKALKMITATRMKAERILEIRAQHQLMIGGLEQVNEKVKSKRNGSTLQKTFDNSTVMLHPIKTLETKRTIAHQEDIVSSTIDFDQKTAISARQQVELQKKFDIVESIRSQRAKNKKQREKSDLRELKVARKRRDSIMQIQDNLQKRKDSLHESKFLNAQKFREECLQEEVGRIALKDQEARRLEKKESKIIKRLKEAHEIQQETITHIQTVFAPSSSQGASPSKQQFGMRRQSGLVIGDDASRLNQQSYCGTFPAIS